MAKIQEQPKKKEFVEWKKPASAAEIEKALLKNLQGFCVKGAREINAGWIPTGHFNLDFAISQGTLPVNVDLSTLKNFNPAQPGGVPKGRLIEFYGEPGGGKSSLALRVVGNAQKAGLVCVWVDKEKSFVESLAEINGVDLDGLYKMDRPEVSAEEEFDHMYSALESGVDLIVVDSVAGLIPKAVLDGVDSTKDTVALLARVMGKCVPKLATICAKTGGTVIFINQIRQKPGVMFGDPTTTPGGETLKFMASLRLQINKRYTKEAEVYKEDENGIQQLIAQESYTYTRKNRFAKTLRDGIAIPIYFEPFFPNAEEVAFDIGRQTQVIKVLNQVFYWKYGEGKNDKIAGETVGRKAFIEAINNAGKINELLDALKAAAADQGIVLPPEITSFKSIDKKKIVKKEAKQTEAAKLIQDYLDQDALQPQEQSQTVGRDEEVANKEMTDLLTSKPKNPDADEILTDDTKGEKKVKKGKK